MTIIKKDTSTEQGDDFFPVFFFNISFFSSDVTSFPLPLYLPLIPLLPLFFCPVLLLAPKDIGALRAIPV